MNRTRCEAGHALPIAAFLLCAMVLVATVVTHTGRAANVQAQAQTAADAAALAGVDLGSVGATEAAKRNGATLVDFSSTPRGAQVTVVIEGRKAVAKADQGAGLGSIGH